MIIIEGNIGVGKTTLLKSIKQVFGNKYFYIDEIFADNVFLKNYYKTRDKNEAFKMQLQFLLDYYNQRIPLLQNGIFGNEFDKMVKGYTGLAILHRSIYSIYHVFVKALEFDPATERLFKQYFDILMKPYEYFYHNSIIYFIDVGIEENIKRVMKRKRDIEMQQDEKFWYDYLKKLNKLYQQYLTFMKEYFNSTIIITPDNSPQGFYEKIDKVVRKKGSKLAYIN